MDFEKLIFVFALKFTLSSHGDCSNLYGKSCPYVPAPVGKTPPCARTGSTFCEDPDGYPGQLIMFLAQQAKFNHRTLVTDETKDEFSLAPGPYPAAKYPTSYKNIDITTSLPYQKNHRHWQNVEPGATSTIKATNFSGKFFDGSGGHQDVLVSQNGGQFRRYKYTSNIPQHFRDMSSRFLGSPSNFRTNFLWKRDVNNFTHMHDRVKRSELFRRYMKEIRESSYKENFTGKVKHKRNKRQDGGLDGETLCQTRSSFIMPRAALNKNGAWMYIVNMENSNQKYTQLVRSEVCVSQTCSSLCGLPSGYTSKCEQKYIQKRLIALQGQGDQLYTDIFWIPSCCVCTIQRN